MDLEKYHRENGAAWDITAAIYERDEQRDIDFLRAGGSSLLAPEQAVLGDLAAMVPAGHPLAVRGRHGYAVAAPTGRGGGGGHRHQPADDRLRPAENRGPIRPGILGML